MYTFSDFRSEWIRDRSTSDLGRSDGNRVPGGCGLGALQIRNPQSAIRNLCLALVLSSVARGAPNGLSWARAYDQGAEHLRAGDLDAAVRELRLAALLNPRHTLARASLKFARDSLGVELLRDARRFLEKKQVRPAMPLLRRAADLRLEDETHEEVTRLLLNFDHEPYEGAWHHHEDVIAFEKRAMHVARNRRRDLELPGRFVLHRRARVRIFTDLDLVPGGARLEGLFDRLDEAIAAYRQLFLPFELDGKWEGLDVVLIERSEDYVSETGSPDTVGIFLPARRASYFSFVRSRTSDELVTVRALFHEVCHQLDYKLLGMTYPPPWLQEGIAFCFEGLRPGGDGTYELRGLGNDTRRYLAGVCPPGSQRWLGLERLVATRDLRPLHGTPEVHDFYAQAGALVHFLLAGPEHDADGPRRRALFYSLVTAARAEGARPKTAAEDFRHFLAEDQWTAKDFEKNFVKALAGMSE